MPSFGQGTKVACEITLMAADAGLVRTDEDIVVEQIYCPGTPTDQF